MNIIVKNTSFDNLVNYSTNESSVINPTSTDYNSVDPTCLSNISKNSQLVKYNLLDTLEKQFEKE